MPLIANNTYFVATPDAKLMKNAGSGGAVNHLLLGDWLRFLGDTDGAFVKVKCRGDVGWLREDQVSEDRAIEVNFVDIGQGDGCHIVTPDDDIILIDAGVGTNMNRFLSWRYNLRGRNVQRAPDFDDSEPAEEPWLIDHVVISHPDNDHYLGFRQVFDNPKLKFAKIYHNGIVERPIIDAEKDPTLWYPSDDDLGGYVEGPKDYIWDVAHTSARTKAIVNAYPTTTKQLISTYRAAMKNSPNVSFKALSRRAAEVQSGTKKFFETFDGQQNDLEIEILGPITEPVTHNGETRHCLRKLGAEDKTKNGHSVVFRMRYGDLKVMLGGDLNTQAQDFLLEQYVGPSPKTSTIERNIVKYQAMGDAISAQDQGKLNSNLTKRQNLVSAARAFFEVDVAKACHHGSHHVLDTFLEILNPVATVISSGDNESHSHPRPDALGAFGKHGRGHRPLIFSTELARSTREFTPVIEYLDTLRAFEARIEAASDPAERRAIEKEMEEKKDRNVAVYGMITLRALGDKVVIAQKLEKVTRQDRKWDLYELTRNPNTGDFEYDPDH